MNFTEPAFLFLFLPCLLAANFSLPKRVRNLLLMLASLLFYGIGEPTFVPVLVVACLLNYGAALCVERTQGTRYAFVWLVLAIIGNLSLLAFFKYCSFAVTTLHSLLGLVGLRPRGFPADWPIPLPLGISFFTFHAISYVVDVYRGTNRAERNPLDVILYVTLFPQLIAGPIIRYHDIAAQLKTRSVRFEEFAGGIGRFVIGLGKKMLVANTVAIAADGIFAIPPAKLTTELAWLGIISYTIQIYYDFSGYSDMAIGLGQMFGFRFLENFNYPYISGSITEFWRRWHISLSNWFRDYLYIPLGGNQVSARRTYLNLIIVFFLCGLWHGASIKFVIWGIFHGVFLVIERLGIVKWLTGTRNPFKHLYVLLVVASGWVLFRAPTLDYAMQYFLAMAGFARGNGLEFQPSMFADLMTWTVMAFACIGAMPVVPKLRTICDAVGNTATVFGRCFKIATELTIVCVLTLTFVVSVALSAAGTYNPFIYFQF